MKTCMRTNCFPQWAPLFFSCTSSACHSKPLRAPLILLSYFDVSPAVYRTWLSGGGRISFAESVSASTTFFSKPRNLSCGATQGNRQKVNFFPSIVRQFFYTGTKLASIHNESSCYDSRENALSATVGWRISPFSSLPPENLSIMPNPSITPFAASRWVMDVVRSLQSWVAVGRGCEWDPPLVQFFYCHWWWQRSAQKVTRVSRKKTIVRTWVLLALTFLKLK